MNFLAFDLGASSGRAILGTFSDNGALELTEVHRFPNGPTERDGAIYWDYPALCAELREGLRKALAVTPDIAGIGIDTWGVDYVLFDAKQKTMKRLPYHYRDTRTDSAMQEVHQIISKDELYRHTGIQFMQFNTIYQLHAHQKQHPEDLQDAFLLLMPDALGYALGGDATTEYTDASTGALLNAETRSWDWELIDRLKLPRTLFTKLVEPGTHGGCLSEELQKELHCNAIPIFKVGSHDTASAVAAVPATGDAPWCYISCGTWALLGAELKTPKLDQAAQSVPFTNEGGVEHTIRFLANIMGSWLFQETRRVWNEAKRNLSFGDMSDMAMTAEPFRYLINPNNQEFFTPGNMPERIRKFLVANGQAKSTDEISDGAVLRAIYESLALYFRTKVEALQEQLGVRYEALNMVGGGTKDNLLMQLSANALGIPVVAGPVEATATGNLAVQAIAAGQLNDLAQAREVIKSSLPIITYQVEAGEKEKFDAQMSRFAQLG